jgi:hypothetical protein
MKKFVFITKYLLLKGIGDERIFITQASQITNHNEKTSFSDISETSQKATYVVVPFWAWHKRHFGGSCFLSPSTRERSNGTPIT